MRRFICVPVCCSVLQCHVRLRVHEALHMCCSVLQCVAVCCSVTFASASTRRFICVAVCCSVLPCRWGRFICVVSGTLCVAWRLWGASYVLQCVVCCSALQHTAVPRCGTADTFATALLRGRLFFAAHVCSSWQQGFVVQSRTQNGITVKQQSIADSITYWLVVHLKFNMHSAHFFFSFLFWVVKPQLRHWTRWVVNTQLIT